MYTDCNVTFYTFCSLLQEALDHLQMFLLGLVMFTIFSSQLIKITDLSLSNLHYPFCLKVVGESTFHWKCLSMKWMSCSPFNSRPL